MRTIYIVCYEQIGTLNYLFLLDFLLVLHFTILFLKKKAFFTMFGDFLLFINTTALINK